MIILLTFLLIQVAIILKNILLFVNYTSINIISKFTFYERNFILSIWGKVFVHYLCVALIRRSSIENSGIKLRFS